MTEFHRSGNYQDYISRINRVLDYIDNNLDKNLTLKELANKAYFSPFHFHRIFRAFVGEPLAQYISRIRLEKAATLLYSTPEISITTIALDCGFSSPATFARAFKDVFQTSASEWRKSVNSTDSKNRKSFRMHGKTIRNTGKDIDISSRYISYGNQQLTWRIHMKSKPEMKADVEVRKMDAMTVVYVRNIGPYKNDAALFEKLIGQLCKWAGLRGLLKGHDTSIISIYHDNPEVTADEKQRISICIEVPDDTAVSGAIGKMTIPAGDYAFARFELEQGQFKEAWDMVYNGWLPESGYQPADRPCFEIYYNDPKDHPQHKFIMDVVVAVKPL
ncbi:MAG: AraC family transcriptional regulator [Candidatus Marinimicrobia bacterium]|nr:AraC family transcriptional regulator [Candidatus Neomarinimicrobiota bacterium]